MRRKAFEVAFRLGIRPHQFMQETSLEELLDIIAYDAVTTNDEWLRHAMLLVKIDRAMGYKRSKIEDYYPPVRKRPKRSTFAQKKAEFDAYFRRAQGASL